MSSEVGKGTNYLGPPTISPSSPVAGAAGASALGSVPGAALKLEASLDYYAI